MYRSDQQPSNLYIFDDKIKIGNLCFVKIPENGLLFTKIGQPLYSSPEILREAPYDYQTDIWSVGCILYELISLQPAFHSGSISDLYAQICKGNYGPINHHSEFLKLLVKSLFKIQPHHRPTTKQLLNLPIIKKYMASRYDIFK